MVLNQPTSCLCVSADEGTFIGTLGFQLFIKRTGKEVVFRSLPIILLTRFIWKSIEIKGSVTLEVILASLLFAFGTCQLVVDTINHQS
jgi:hypothetical protein